MNISTLELLRRLYVAGVDIGLNDADGLRLTGHEPTPDLLDELKVGKDGVLTLLQQQGAGTETMVWTVPSRAAMRRPQDAWHHGCVPASVPVAAS